MCKKEDKKEDPVTPNPLPTEQFAYGTFSIILVDLTSPTNISSSSFTNNLQLNSLIKAYSVADSARIDSMSIVVTYTPDIVASSVSSGTATPCDWPIWNSYNINSKQFKLKKGANNSLQIFENGTLISSRPIIIKSSSILFDFNSQGYNSSSPKVNGRPCADGLRYYVMR